VLEERLQFDQSRHGFLLAHGKAFLGSATLDAGLDREQRGDAFERLFGDGRAGRNRDLVETASGVRPAGHLGQPRVIGLGAGGIELVEPGISIGVQKAAATVEQGLGMLAFAIGRIAIEDGRRRPRSPGSFIAHQHP
jgi:hypothetical protein